jgi:hypothetical protein
MNRIGINFSSVFAIPIGKILAWLSVVLICGCASHSTQSSEGSATPQSPPKVVYLGGEFRKPALYTWTNGITAIDAIRQAGGFTIFAGRELEVVHLDGSHEIYRLTTDRQGTNDTGWIVPNISLKPGDNVLSPGSPYW